MCIVTCCGLILNVTGVDCDSASSLFGSVIDLVICHEFDITVFERKSFGDSRSQSGLTVVNVTDGTDINVGLGSFKMCLCHWKILLKIIFVR